jgi:hypothetical protein
MLTRGRTSLLVAMIAVACSSGSGPAPADGSAADSGAAPDAAAREAASPDTLEDAGLAGDVGAGPARGAMSIDFRAPAGCKAPAALIDLPRSASGRAVTATSVGDLLTDDGVQVNHTSGVSCAMVPAGGRRFFLSAKIYFDRPAEVYVSLDVTIGPGETADGGFTIIHPGLPARYASSAANPCHFSVVTLEGGKAWGQLDCPTLPSSSDGALCQLGPTYFYFEGCRSKP